MDVAFSAATDVGRQRDHNEDNFLVDPKLHLFVVADGMGGHAAGEVASQVAVHELRLSLQKNGDLLDRFAADKAADTPEARQEILAVLEHAVQHASAAIYKMGEEDAAKRGMATTLSALVVAGGRGFIAHVGDSRIYLLRQGQVHQLTEDHSLINELIKRGKLKREEVDRSPYAKHKNAITRAVGAHESVEADLFDFEVLSRDHFLICSDGLHAYLKDADLIEIFGGGDLDEAPKTMVALANAGGGHDNITALVVRATDSDTARAADLAQRVDVLKGMPLFRFLNYKEIIQVLNATSVRQYNENDPIFAEGAPGEELYVILDGKVRLHKAHAFITTLERGAHFGEMALVDRSPRSTSATAETPVRMLIMRTVDFYDIIRKHPRLATKLLWSFVQVLAERLRKTTADLSGARLEAAAEDLSKLALFDPDK